MPLADLPLWLPFCGFVAGFLFGVHVAQALGGGDGRT